jgi:DNA-directed RNA polymerase specialized sigma24 family protein
MNHDDSSGVLEDPSSSASFYGEFQGSEDEFNQLFTRIMTLFRSELETHLFQRGASRTECEEIVQDFFVKQYQKRTAFARLDYWLHVAKSPQRVLGFLRTCVLHHFIDSRRKLRRDQLGRDQAEQSTPEQSNSRPGLDPLDYAWAVSVLQVAVHDLKTALLGDGPIPDGVDKQTAGAFDRNSRLLNWQVFVERFISPSVRHVIRGRKFTAAEIAARLRLSRDQVLHRAQQVRDLFACHLRQALIDSCPDTDPDALLLDLRNILVLGNASLPDLLAEVPEFFAESNVDTFNVFSLASSDDLPRDEVADLMIRPTPSPDEHETRDLWELFMRREYQPHPGSRSGTNGLRPASVEEIIFAPQTCIHSLQTIKKLARENGQREHKILQEIYHALYALVIARAKNVFNQTITSLPAEQRLHSLAYAARYPWLPTRASREIELAIHKYSDPNDQSNLAP